MTGWSSLHMLKCSVRTLISIVLFSVSALTTLLQPLSADEQTFVSALSRLEALSEIEGEPIVRTVDTSEIAVHTFYSDWLIGPNAPIETLIVLPLEALDAAIIDTLTRPQTKVHLAIVAPRNPPTTIPSVIEAFPGYSQRTAVVYVTMGHAPEWRMSVEGFVSPAWFARTVIESGTAPFSPALVNAAKLGLGERDAVLQTALGKRQNAARLSVPDLDELYDTVRPFAELVAATTATGSVRRFEENYLILPSIPTITSPIVVVEATLVWSIVVIAGFFLLFAVARPRRVQRYLSAIRHNWLLFTGLFAVLFATLIIGNLLIRVVVNVFPGTVSAIPLATIKLSLGIVALTLLYPLTHGRFRRSTTVYSGAALFLLLLGSLIASTFSIILGMFFVVAAFFGFLFSLSHNAPLKALSLLFAITPGAYLLYEIAAVADPQAIRILLTPTLWREAVTAIMILPLALMFFRLDILVTPVPLLPLMGMVATVAIAISSAVIVDSITEGPEATVGIQTVYPAPGAIENVSVPETGEVEIVGQWPEGALTAIIDDARGQTFRCETPPCANQVVAPAPPVTVRTTIGRALDRYTLSYSIEFRRPSRAFTLTVRGEEDIQLYATDLPASVQTGAVADEFTFHPGPYPPSTVTGTIVFRGVPEESRITTRVDARFAGTPVELVHTKPEVVPTLSEYTVRWSVLSQQVAPQQVER